MRNLNSQESLQIQLGVMVRALEILLPKRLDYSADNSPFANIKDSAHSVEIHPVQGCIQRLHDKLRRVIRMVVTGKAFIGEGDGNCKESIFDSDLPDAVNYVCIAAGLLAEQNTFAYKYYMDKAAQLPEILKLVQEILDRKDTN